MVHLVLSSAYVMKLTNSSIIGYSVISEYLFHDRPVTEKNAAVIMVCFILKLFSPLSSSLSLFILFQVEKSLWLNWTYKYYKCRQLISCPQYHQNKAVNANHI